MVLRFLAVGIIYLFTDFLYWTRFCTSTILLHLKRIKGHRRFNLYNFEVEDQPEKNGIIVPKEEILLESPLCEKELQESADEIFIYGVSSKSETLLVRILRITNDESEAWIYLKLSDGRTFYLDQANGYQCNTDGKITSFTCGGLKMYSLCAMRRWRIIYSGMLNQRKHVGENEPVFVKFTFIWTASSDVYDTTSDLDLKLTAKAMAEVKWDNIIPPVEKLEETLNSYCQSGVINGTITIEDEPVKEMYLFGERIRYLGKTSNLEGSTFKTILGVVPQTGLFIHLNRMSIPNIVKNLFSGFVVNPSSKIDIVEDGLITSVPIGTDRTHEKMVVKFKAEKEFEIPWNTAGKRMPLNTDKSFGGIIEMVEIKFKIDGYDGRGLMFTGDIFKMPQKIHKGNIQKVATLFPKDRPLTIHFSEEESHLAELAGGKGSSLGKLTKLSSEMKSEFIVPKGIIVTTEAYNRFLTHEITEKIEKMKNIAYSNTEGNIHEACKIVQTAVENASLPKQLTEEIESKLKLLFGNNTNGTKFAVRSSATGEDTEQMSAAGQMETFLGIKGLKEIYNAVKKCWASQFGYIAVEYKRQNGQILNSSMAVVIQEMVECESSGVLFTCDPVTNNPSVIVITSNYGLGESVVSGSEEPDTIILQRISHEDVKLKDVIIGLKQRKIVLSDSNSSETHGTVLEDVPEEKQKLCCISEETAINLGKLSLKIENYFKSLRDIEWGIKDKTIYILQSRPITTGEAASDYEIMHEFDGPMRCEDDIMTTCNVGEVFPNALSPLGFEVLNKAFSLTFLKEYRKKIARNYYQQTKYFPTGLVPFCYHTFMSAVDVATFGSNDVDSMDAKGMMISVFGRILDDPEIKEKIKQRNFSDPKSKIKPLLYMIWCLFFAKCGINSMKQKVFNYKTPALKAKEAKEIFSILLKFPTHTSTPFERHIDCSSGSSFWNMFIFSVLTKAKGAVDNDVYGDFAKLLASSSNVESADIPTAMQKLAHSIIKDIDREKFKAMPLEDAQQWLETSRTESGNLYREFIKRHGHRCLCEMDVYRTPWSADPKPLIELLQDMSGCCAVVKPKKEAQFSEILPHLKIPLKLKSRLLLKLILPNCRNGIRSREICKSMVVKSFDNMRKGFQHLSKTMVSEGYLPDAELMFFLTMDEINELLETRNPRLIARAKHRRKLFPLMDSLKFPEMSTGLPVPINHQSEEQVEFEANLIMKGVPVSQGTVKGYARVALYLKDASDLKPGEILITLSTDIAWSPYFPILGGVVTEIGGLISHGAVVSREYGLPCVVGLRGATKHFVTGDYVLLDGNKGTLQRLSCEETK